MLALLLGAGILSAVASSPAPASAAGGGYEYIPVKRNKRKTEGEERAEIRALIERAFSDPAPEAEAVIAIAQPVIRHERVIIDWSVLDDRMAALSRAVEAYEARLRCIRDETDEDEMIILAMVI